MNTIIGLSQTDASILFKKFGPNELPSKAEVSQLKLLVSQFKNALVLLLVIAALISYFVGNKLDSVLIFVIIILNASMGFWQEYKASKELEALRKLEVATTRVIRDGKQIEISALNIVPGDIIILESGDKIPADAKIIESYKFSVNESALTGESVPVYKTPDPSDGDIYFGTTVITGRCKAQVIKTGTLTRFGAIAIKLSGLEEEQTPLEKNLADFSKKISVLAIFAAIIIFAVRFFQGYNLFENFFTSIALMVAAVPEGLPTVITLALAIGVRRMYQKKTLVRKLSSIESLGSTTIICSDKTGTLTKNIMTVKEVVSHLAQEKLLECAILCNSASLVLKEDHGTYDILGDTTEGALLLWAKEQKTDIDALKNEGEIVDELPFDLKRRMMSILWDSKGHKTLYSKGAPESILPLCNLEKVQIDRVMADYEKMASSGLRVLAFAYSNNQTNQILERNLEFLGLIGIADTPRPEAGGTIQKARKAGIEIVMITGDNELTAKAIAKEVGLLKEGDEILSGFQLDELSDEALQRIIKKVRVFARVIPEQKLRIIKIYQSLGEVVAVTGDGVNDALALKQAQVGIAMGSIGTEVAKEASDVIILDDNLSTIVSAIEQGRLIYSNILKVIKFLMAGNLSELLLIAGAVSLGLPTPLLPVQILWINFVTDGLPALALTADSASSKIMQTPPRDKNLGFLNHQTINFILISGGLIAAGTLAIFYLFLKIGDLTFARSYAFSIVVILQMILIFAMRRHHGVFSNRYLLFAVSSVIILQGLILYYPPLQQIFKTESGI